MFLNLFRKSLNKFGETNKKLRDTETEKHKFHQHRSPILIGNVNINKAIVFSKVSFGKKGFKYFIGYKDDKEVRKLCIMLPKWSGYRRGFDETICPF